LRKFQLRLVDRGTSPITLNATIKGLKFFFGVTLNRAELMSKMRPVFVPRTLPVVLSREEVASLIAATHYHIGRPYQSPTAQAFAPAKSQR
jgi:hypothetical protein